MKRDIIFVSIERTFLLIGKFISIILISRTLGPEGQGIYSFYNTALATGTIFSLLGFDISNNYYGARIEEDIDLPHLLGNTLAFSLLVSAFLSILVGALCVLSFLPEAITPFLITIFLVGNTANILSVALGRLVFGIGCFKEHMISVALHEALFIMLLLQAIFFGFLDPFLACWFWVVALALRVLYSLIVVLRKSAWRMALSLRTFKKQFIYGIGAYLYSALNVLNFRLNNLIVGIMLGPSSLGFYSVAVNATEVLLYLPNTITCLVLTEVSKKGEIPKQVFRIISTSLAITAIVIGVCSPLAIPFLLGKDFINSVSAIEILLFGTYALGMAVMGVHYLFGLADRMTPSKASVVNLLVLVSADLLLIPLLDTNGAALASTLAYCSMCFVIYVKMSQVQNQQFQSYFTPILSLRQR